MKKQNNITVLKAMLNTEALEVLEVKVYGVQAYRIDPESEYNVIVKAEKINGRYYFIDRDGRRFLMSHYDRADIVAGEFIERIEEDRQTVKTAADQIEKYGRVMVRAGHDLEFRRECDRRGHVIKSVLFGHDNAGVWLTTYELVKVEEPQHQANRREATSAEIYRVYENVKKDAETLAKYILCEGEGVHDLHRSIWALQAGKIYGVQLTAAFDVITGVIRPDEAAERHIEKYGYTLKK